MNLFVILLFALASPQESFTRFSFCRETPRGIYETQCLDLKPDGTGELVFKRRGSEEVRLALALSPAGRDRFIGVITGTNYLSGSANYETKRRVADLGRKHIIIEMPSGRREADFNYSDLKEVNALATFFDAMLNQGTLMFDLDFALRFERLSVPERLDNLEKELKANRIADPQSLAPLLDKIEQDQRVMDYARSHAQQLKQRVSGTK